MNRKLLLLILSLNICADYIQNFDSNIIINLDGSIDVTENIDAYLENAHGILRDIPTKYSDNFTGNYEVDFNVLSVSLKNRAIQHSLIKMHNGWRIKIGNPGTYLPRGLHAFKIKYNTKGFIGFFKDHDELYWNVTGNGWPYVIQKATATVQLPENINVSEYEAYTSLYRSQDRNYISKKLSNNSIYFETTKPLYRNQGFTIVVAWPKTTTYTDNSGVQKTVSVQEPTIVEKTSGYLKANLSVLILLFALIILLVYYLCIYNKFGRGEASVVIPHFDPPKDFLPVDCAYLLKKRFDQKGAYATIIDMAVSGYFKLDNQAGRMLINLLGKPNKNDFYDKFYDSIAAKYKSPVIVKEGSGFGQFINSKLSYYSENKLINYIVFNLGYVLFGGFISAIAIFLAFMVASVDTLSFVAIFIIALILLVNYIFYFKLQHYTKEGQALVDHILGFKMFLSFTEKDRLKYTSIPDQTPQEYEVFLPYAVAFGVEELWTKQFSRLFLDLEKSGNPYVPVWCYYRGKSFNYAHAPSSFFNDFSRTIAASEFKPGSRSGLSSGGGRGGGGFSGGGGGGGGGGSW